MNRPWQPAFYHPHHGLGAALLGTVEITEPVYVPTQEELEKLVAALRAEIQQLSRENTELQQLPIAHPEAEVAQLRLELQEAQRHIARLQHRLIVASLDHPTDPYDWDEDSLPDSPESPFPTDD